ncbi:MAG: cation diffusion facilitator family transporter [Acidimicrobiia bacterium]|nr:MAG: cation diffusion facilitator family transporter [Acidimicrobiia bacterium]
MSAGHDHSSLGSAKHVKPLAIAFTMIASFAFIELIAGIATGSLALTADAGHMFTDALGLGMALAAAVLVGRVSPSAKRTFGLFRLEIMAALANAAILLGVATFVIVQAIGRLRSPVEIEPGIMTLVAVGGLIVNVIAYRLLKGAADESLNVQGAFLEVLGDLLASVGVVIAGIVIFVTGWSGIDALVGIAIGLFILPRALGLARKAVRILIESAPDGFDVESLRSALVALPEVLEVHDLHVWTLTSDMNTATAHIVIDDGIDSHPTLDAARDVLAVQFGIDHATFQIEPASHSGCDEMAW